mgnify:FL=1
MDKIYSRNKIRIPAIKWNGNEPNKTKKIYFTIILFVITTITSQKILKAVNPIFEGLCTSKAQSIATDISNRKSSEVLAKYNYKDTVTIIKDENNKNSILKTDIVVLNQIISDIAIEMQKDFDTLKRQTISIPAGALLGNQYLSGFGPQFKIKIIPAGDLTTEIKTEFKEAGINQTVYRIYLNIECNVSILTAYKTINRTIANQVLLVETVIVGEVPETYLHLKGIE